MAATRSNSRDTAQSRAGSMPLRHNAPLEETSLMSCHAGAKSVNTEPAQWTVGDIQTVHHLTQCVVATVRVIVSLSDWPL